MSEDFLIVQTFMLTTFWMIVKATFELALRNAPEKNFLSKIYNYQFQQVFLFYQKISF